MKRTEPHSIRQIIDAVMMQDNIRTTALEHRAAWLWGEVVGPGVNRLTTRRYMSSGTLHVYISSSSLKQELSFMRQAIADHINRALGHEVVTGISLH